MALYEERAAYAPLVLFEYPHDPGHYSLMLSDASMVSPPILGAFESHGRESTGYGWADVALAAIRRNAPELETRLGMDPEAGMFVAHGQDLEALQKLGRLLAAAHADPKALGELVAIAPWEND